MKRQMARRRLELGLVLLLALGVCAAVTIGETPLSRTQYLQGFTQPESAAAEILWTIRAPRVVAAAVVGACLGLSGGLLQGLLRNPLADPGILGVSATAGLGAALAIVFGLALLPGGVETAALVGAGVGGLAILAFAARFPEPEALILFGVALSSFAGAVTALVFNLSPSPVATSDVLAWLLGSVENRSWTDVAWGAGPLVVAGALSALTGRGLRALTLGEETAKTSGLDLHRLKLIAIAAAAIATGAAVAIAGIIGFVGLAAPHLVRRAVREDPERLLIPSALAGAVMLVGADLLARVLPTPVELKLGVLTALVGAPLFAVLAWRAARSWRS
jgi:iron complex transport system permease protein